MKNDHFVLMMASLAFGLWAGMTMQDRRVDIAHEQRNVAVDLLNKALKDLETERIIRNAGESLLETKVLLRSVDEFEPVIDEEAVRPRRKSRIREELMEEIDRALKGEKRRKDSKKEPPAPKPKPRFVTPRDAKIALL